MGKEYITKSYRLFIMWAVGFLALLIAVSILASTYFSEVTIAIIVKIILLLTLLSIFILFYIIYKTENIYWINGTNYEEAKAATSESRKKFAMAHLKVFLKATAIYGAYCIIGTIIDTSAVIDTVIFLTLSIGAAIKTMPIKL